MPRVNQTDVLLNGDLTPEFTDYVDLRNDNAGSDLQQMRMIILRYLGSRLGDDTVQFEEMYEDLVKRFPFLGEEPESFLEALDSLVEDNFVRMFGPNLAINKVARVTHAWLARKAR